MNLSKLSRDALIEVVRTLVADVITTEDAGGCVQTICDRFAVKNDGDLSQLVKLASADPTLRTDARYVYMPGIGSTLVEGFPAAILGYRAEEVSHIVPGRYERDLVDWACTLAPGSKQFVDCGAHMGSWTLVMARHFREVHAFEPQRLLFQQLCGNAALNGLANVFAYNMGLDARPGQLILHRPGVDRGSSSARADVTERLNNEGIETSPESIAVTTLDSFGDLLNDVGLVKIDVEGLELRVLQGAVSILRRHKPKLLVECWSNNWYRDDKRKLLGFLSDLDYRVIPINGYADVLLAEAL